MLAVFYIGQLALDEKWNKFSIDKVEITRLSSRLESVRTSFIQNTEARLFTRGKRV
jgi:hypothetical protein